MDINESGEKKIKRKSAGVPQGKSAKAFDCHTYEKNNVKFENLTPDRTYV